MIPLLVIGGLLFALPLLKGAGKAISALKALEVEVSDVGSSSINLMEWKGWMKLRIRNRADVAFVVDSVFGTLTVIDSKGERYKLMEFDRPTAMQIVAQGSNDVKIDLRASNKDVLLVLPQIIKDKDNAKGLVDGFITVGKTQVPFSKTFSASDFF